MTTHRKSMVLSRRVRAPGDAVNWERRQFFCDVYMEIDIDRLFETVGFRAMQNKSKRSQYLHGIITAKVTVKGEVNDESDKGTTEARGKTTSGV